MSASPLRVAIIGMDGFARDHHRSIRQLEQEGLCRLICTCDPRMESYTGLQTEWDFTPRGVRTFTDYQEMLAACHDDLDVVTIPTPVPLHAPMHEACMAADLACYLEKPPTLDSAELERMLEAEAWAQEQTQVGFLYIAEPARQALKRRLVDGEFGRIRRVTFRGLSPRADLYYARAGWAGRLMLDGKRVLDSCIGNAMAHHLHNLHFWAGQDALFSWEGVEKAEAELYRAHPIEGVDTVFMRGFSPSGVEFRVAASHACPFGHDMIERVECDRANWTYDSRKGYELEWNDGRKESETFGFSDLLTANLTHYFHYLRGEAERPMTRLVDSRPFVQFYDLCYVAAKRIVTVPDAYRTIYQEPDRPGEHVAIQNIVAIAETFLQTGQFPSAQGAEWAQTGGAATQAELGNLPTVVEAMVAERQKETATWAKQ